MTARERWTEQDDAALAAAAAQHHVETALAHAIATTLGIEPAQIQVISARIPPPRPCRHWRCRARRWWRALTT